MDVTRQRPRLLQRREVAAYRHLSPPDDVEHTLYPLAGRVDNFLGEPRIAKRRLDLFARTKSKRVMSVLFVDAKSR